VKAVRNRPVAAAVPPSERVISPDTCHVNEVLESVCSEVAGNLVSVTVNLYFHKASILYLHNSEFLLHYTRK
jgi:hypothetical protein